MATKPPAESRVLVALGAAAANRGAVETGVGLAAAMGAALDALFVEDANLLRLGALPFASEISALTGARRTFSGRRNGARAAGRGLARSNDCWPCRPRGNRFDGRLP